MDENYRLMPLPSVDRVITRNKLFEKKFSIYSTNNFGALEIINEEMQQNILNFQRNIGREIRLSIVNGIMYVAISIDEDLLAPSIAHPEDKENIKKYFFSVLLVLSIINQLRIDRLV